MQGVGITPAYAGKRGSSSLIISPFRDHPCVCGEKKKSLVRFELVPGSPLRMRGKGYKVILRFAFYRITPAYAGKRGSSSLIISPFRDHPCVCGEKAVRSCHGIGKTGSPLRMRGKVAAFRHKPSLIGITPAYAGKRLKKIPILLHSSQRSCPKIFNFFLEP